MYLFFSACDKVRSKEDTIVIPQRQWSVFEANNVYEEFAFLQFCGKTTYVYYNEAFDPQAQIFICANNA